MVEFIDSDAWNKLDFPLKGSVFFKSDFLDNIQSSFNYKVHYLVCKEREEVLFAAAIFSNKNNAIVPLTFTYSSFYFSQSLSQLKYLSICGDFICLLKTKFNKMVFRLPPDIKDVRPFLWEQFTADVRYTNVKKTVHDDVTVHEKVLKAAKKALKTNWQFEVISPNKEIIEESLATLKKQGLSSEVINNYRKFFNKIGSRYLLSFNVMSGKSAVASGVSLLDEHTKKLYALLVFSKEKHYANKYMQYQRILWAKQNGYDSIDFCGANEKGIATFKAFLEPQLEAYYVVRYHPLKSTFLDEIQKVRKKIGRIKRKIYFNK